MDIYTLGLFVVTFASLLILPGPNAAFVVGQSLQLGALRASPVIAGFVTATGIHAVIVFSGLGAILINFTGALTVLKWLGVCYLLYLAYNAFRAKQSQFAPSTRIVAPWRLYFAAMGISLTNPKALLANLMIYPMFVSIDSRFAPQAMTLIVAAMMTSCAVYSGYLCVTHFFRQRFQQHLSKKLSKQVSQQLPRPLSQHVPQQLVRSTSANKIIGTVYVAAACALATK